MNNNYETNIDNNKPMNQQKLLPETEDIIALIYYTYWEKDEEKAKKAKKYKR